MDPDRVTPKGAEHSACRKPKKPDARMLGKRYSVYPLSLFLLSSCKVKALNYVDIDFLLS